jgi:hypothetical protein
MRIWSLEYGSFLEPFPPTGAKTFLFFDDFVQRPNRLLAPLFERLNLDYSPEFFSSRQVRHVIGGHFAPKTNLWNANSTIDIKPLPDPQLTAKERETIANNGEMQRVFAAMRERHLQHFKG